MNKIGIIACVFTGLLMMLPARAKADNWDQKTVVTFSEPVQIPGLDLSAGTYVFKLAESMSDRDIIQVFDKSEKHLYGTFLAVPDYRLKPSGKTIITFSERPAGTPEALRAWFYPGDNFGHQFVYPKRRASELARANRVSVPSVPDESGSRTAIKGVPLTAQQPDGEEVDASRDFPPAQNQAGTGK